ncbi:hypothetical protein KM043_001399 [Ampulex compressa]|nr:hypothetical protein KM043_001399 [Ampulex compressa]
METISHCHLSQLFIRHHLPSLPSDKDPYLLTNGRPLGERERVSLIFAHIAVRPTAIFHPSIFDSSHSVLTHYRTTRRLYYNADKTLRAYDDNRSYMRGCDGFSKDNVKAQASYGNGPWQAWSRRDIMYLKFPGELFMRTVNCLILPLVTTSIVGASCNLGKSGTVGLIALCYYTTTTVLGITLSVILVETIRPGELVNENNYTSTTTRHYMTQDTLLDLLRNLIPDNIVNACLHQFQTVLERPENSSKVPISEWTITSKDASGTNVLGLVFYSLLMGVAIGKSGRQGKPLLDFFHCFSEVSMTIMNWVIMLAPVAVLFLISGRILEVEDFGDIVRRLGIFILTVLLGLLLQGFVILPLVYCATTRKSPYKIIRSLGPAFATACATSSSTATVPVTIKCLEKVGIDPRISKFIVPIGATINMDGIALYETIGAIFIIQLSGLQISLFRVIAISVTCTISCIGAAGLPNGGYTMLIMVLNSIGVPVDDVSLIIAIDWFLDRFRTTINIIADGLGAGIMSHFCKDKLTDATTSEAQPSESYTNRDNKMELSLLLQKT